jgi:hypothetical protein
MGFFNMLWQEERIASKRKIRRFFLPVLVLAVVGHWFGFWGGKTKAETKLEGEQLSVVKGSYRMKFSLKTPLDGDYMVFGVQTDKGKDDFDDGYLAVIPIKTVKTLKKTYADIDSCNGAGADAARSHVQNLHLFAYSPGVKTAMRAVFDQDLAAQRTGGDRICVRARGRLLDYDSGTYRGVEMTAPRGANGEMQLLYPESIEIVSCQT